MWSEDLEYDGADIFMPVIYLVQEEGGGPVGTEQTLQGEGRDVELILVDSDNFIPDFGPENLS